MGSVQSIKECPQCHGVYMTDYNCRTDEEHRVCFRCGRRENWFIVRDEKNNPVLDEKGKVQGGYELAMGYGSMNIAYKNGFGRIISFHEPVSEEDRHSFLEALKDEEVDGENSYLTLWDSEKETLIAVYGKLPESYQELMD